MRNAAVPAFPVHDITPRTGSAGGSVLMVERIDHATAFTAPHRHAFTQFVLIEAGTGTHSIDFSPVPIRAGEIHVLAPGQVHEWRADAGLRVTALMFSEDALHGVGKLPERVHELVLLGAAPLALGAQSLSRVRRLLEAIAEAGSLEIAGHLVAALLLECTGEERLRFETTAHSPLTRSFLRIVLRSPDARMTVSKCAARLGVTAGYLTEQVVADTGSTPGRVLRTAIAREAQRMLSGTAMSAAQISAELGFSEPSYFSRFFRREVGCTPTDYREVPRSGAAQL